MGADSFRWCAAIEPGATDRNCLLTQRISVKVKDEMYFSEYFGEVALYVCTMWDEKVNLGLILVLL